MAEDINALYRQMLGREAGPQGLQYWSDLQRKGATMDDIRGGIANSPEFKSFSATNPGAAAAAPPPQAAPAPAPATSAAPDRTADLNRLYQENLGRDVGPAGLEYFTNSLNSGNSLDDVRNNIRASPEFKSFSATNPGAAAAAPPPQAAPAPAPATSAAPDRTADLNRLYQENLGRDVGPAGLEYFTNSLNSGKSLDDVRNNLRASPEFSNREYINGMFNANLGRDAEPDAMQYYLGEMSRGMGREKVKTNIQASKEFGDYNRSQGQGQGGVNNAPPKYADPSDGFKYTQALGGPTQGADDIFSNSYKNLLGRDIQENERFAIGNKSVADLNNQLKASDEYKARTPQGFKGFSDPNIGQIFYEPGRPLPPVNGSYTPRGPDMAKALRANSPEGQAAKAVVGNPFTQTPRGQQ